MASFGRVTSEASVSLVAGSTHEEEKPYWEANEKGPQKQLHDTPPIKFPGKTNNQGFLSKLSGTEIGSTYENFAKNIGSQAKTLGDQAKIFGEQAKGYTVANTCTAATAMNRFKNQVVAAVDGVPIRRDEDQPRESGTTSAGRDKGGEEDGDEQGKQRDEMTSEQPPGSEEDTSIPSATAAVSTNAAGVITKRHQVIGGIVDENGPMLGLGALAAAFKAKPIGGAIDAQTQGGSGLALETSSSVTATMPSDSSAGSTAGAGGGDQGEGRRGGAEDAGGLKIIPRTASLVGGKQWAVLASVYDTTASVVDETIGDLFT